MSRISTTGTDRNELNERLDNLALSTLFAPDELAEIRATAQERGISAVTLIRGAVINSLY